MTNMLGTMLTKEEVEEFMAQADLVSYSAEQNLIHRSYVQADYIVFLHVIKPVLFPGW